MWDYIQREPNHLVYIRHSRYNHLHCALISDGCIQDGGVMTMLALGPMGMAERAELVASDIISREHVVVALYYGRADQRVLGFIE